MKNLFFVFLFVPMALFATAQSNPGLDAVSKALSTGDVETLSKYFAGNVEVSIQDKEQLYSKAQAMEVVKSFFAANKPKEFNQVHNGTSRGSTDQYCIGNLTATTGTYRVYLYFKTTDANMVIQEIRFDKE